MKLKKKILIFQLIVKKKKVKKKKKLKIYKKLKNFYLKMKIMKIQVIQQKNYFQNKNQQLQFLKIIM
jgi:hypothetical protein